MPTHTRKIFAAGILALGGFLSMGSYFPGDDDGQGLWARLPTVASAEHEACGVSVRGPGNYFVIYATGLAPGEKLQFNAVNGDRDLMYNVRADADGAWGTIFLPFRPDRTSGVVHANIVSANCFLSFSFPWTKNYAHAYDLGELRSER